MNKYKSTKAVYRGSDFRSSCDYSCDKKLGKEAFLLSISEEIENLRSTKALEKVKKLS